ncbi:LamG-like jellyroll fold domain-containing protein [Flavobacterium sp. P21]|uniref:LamG-like jellyroll fold domain-containing protein n=1 Tax=Flavobacterium sp. P21 TaxID=3423948 RepID=UPI003D67891C
MIGNCANFGNSITHKNRIVIPDNDSISFVNKKFAMSFWLNLSAIRFDASVYGNISWFLNKRNDSDNLEYQCGIVNGELFAGLFNNGGKTSYIHRKAGNYSFLNKWTNIIFSYNNTNNGYGLHIYANGIEISTTSSDIGTFTSLSNTNTPLILGQASWNLGFAPLLGKMCEYYIYDNAVTPEQALFIYNEGLAGRSLI